MPCILFHSPAAKGNKASATPDAVSRNFASDPPFEIIFSSEQSLADTDYRDLRFISVQCGEEDGVEGDGGGVIYA